MVLLLAIAAVVNGLLAGASLDQSIEQLPARHRIGVRAYLAYSHASHMANGRFWLIPLGIAGPLLSIAAAFWAGTLGLPANRWLPIFVGGGVAILNLLSTFMAARINWTIAPWTSGSQKAAEDESALSGIYNRFERWQGVRAAVQFLSFAVAVWALAVNGV